jgi:neutral trehalase
MARARRQPQGTGQRTDVGRSGRPLLRLQLPDEAPARIRVRDDVLPALGEYRGEEQAARVRANLSKFKAPGGILTSTQITGSQWDAPFGWAPLQMIAVEGLRRYGYAEDADRVAGKFISLVAKEFQEHGTIVEKYDLRRLESGVAAGIQFGYSANQIGFGWTNAVFLELLAGMRQPVTR